MKGYTVIIKQSTKKQTSKLPVTYQNKVKKVVLDLEKQPRPHGYIKLTGANNVYRIVYEIADKLLMIYIFDVEHRKDVYR
jgi:mRNA interferase RelE/StbE